MKFIDDNMTLRDIAGRIIAAIGSAWAIWVLSVALTSHDFPDSQPPTAEQIEAQLEREAKQRALDEYYRQLEDDRRARERSENEQRLREQEQRRADERREEVLLEEGWGAD